MTNPVGTPPGGNLQNGMPNLQAAVPAGKTTIWNIPTDIAGKPFWFDVGHKENTPSHRGGISNEAVEAGKSPAHGPTSYEIMSKPEDVMKQLAALSYNSPQQFIALQTALASGVFGTVKVSGVFDPNTEAALGRAMLQYVKLSQGAGVGVSFKDYLIQSGSSASALQQQQSQQAAPQVNLADPDSIRAAAQSAAMQALGQGMSESQLNHFVAQFQAAQTASQTSTAASATTPSLSDDAMAYAQQTNPGAYQQNQRSSYLDAMVNLLGGSKTSRPNTTPTPKVG